MKNKTLIFIFALILFCIIYQSDVWAASATIETAYNFSNISVIDGNIYQADSIVLMITTPIETLCFYGNSLIPSNPFEGEYGLTHEAYLEGLTEGLHQYYIRCGDSSNPVMEIDFATSIPVYATIHLSESPPLKAGKYTIDLTTSKPTIDTPTLQYSFDQINYKPIYLTGSGENWEGNLIIPDDTGDTICSFTFKATDIAGEDGTTIVGDNSFIIDTTKPSAISIINAVGSDGQITLNWFLNEQVNEFNIYRSENPGVDYTDFYTTSNKNSFEDNNVEKGQTYYYRVAGVDEAGNIADLSKEVYATALLANYTATPSGLDPSLVGKVDNFVTEITSVLSNIDQIKSLIESNTGEEKTLFSDIQLDKKLDDATSQLNSLERDVENYKLEDLSDSELDTKISSESLKLDIIKKQIPESITITNEKQLDRVLDENTIQKLFLEYSSNTNYDYKKETDETLKLIQNGNIKITSNFYNVEITYLDGTKDDISVVKDIINSSLGNVDNLYFVSSIPKEIAETSSELKIMNLQYSVIQDDPVIAFNSDTTEIIYYVDKEVSLDDLQNILIAPLKFLNNETTSSTITGNSILNSASNGPWGIVALIILAFGLGIYFLRIRSNSSIKPVLKMMEDIKKVKELLKEGKVEEGKELYNMVKEEYKLLSKKEKAFIIDNLKKMNEEIAK